ncbi:hypothetical protein H4CHR_02955 [Variovorax sp. PBS-H4]|uniref:hypothetical protein n=1 Tax=Variovorax sp. PBS-H4 TaxID=434008 RepID=UPI001315DDA1|nr:hypothetical protein [Variovorax sp. PBS-H4]VTU32160.1 hypothetical protein H4CHR_02955 [Variovorax sp. PBS-H4]
MKTNIYPAGNISETAVHAVTLRWGDSLPHGKYYAYISGLRVSDPLGRWGAYCVVDDFGNLVEVAR